MFYANSVVARKKVLFWPSELARTLLASVAFEISIYGKVGRIVMAVATQKRYTSKHRGLFMFVVVRRGKVLNLLSD